MRKSPEKRRNLQKQTKNNPKTQKTRGKIILDNQGVTTYFEKTKKSVRKTWENYT